MLCILSSIHVTFIILSLIIILCSFQTTSDLRLNKYFVDLGKVKTGERAGFELKMFNLSEKTLDVYEVKASCSCVQIEEFPKQILKGDTGLVKGYASSGTKGEVLKYIHIKSSSKSGDQTVSVKAVFE